MQLSKDLSNKIANMSFVCACLVVSIHIKWDGGFGGGSWWMAEMFKGGYSKIAVPFFLRRVGICLLGALTNADGGDVRRLRG